jgi:hypothetical protein
MTMTPPPSRYKVVEKNGRLITIDTLAGKSAGDVSAARSAMTDEEPRLSVGDILSHMPADTIGVRQQKGLESLATMFTETDRSGKGGLILRTHRFYDPDAPRRVRLSNRKAQMLGALGLGGIVLVFVVAGFLLSGQIIPLFVIGFITLRAGMPLAKRALAYIIADAEEVADA